MHCPDSDPILKTSDFYRTCQLPKRFEYPCWFHGYGIQKQPPEHPFYKTTSSDYGRYGNSEFSLISLVLIPACLRIPSRECKFQIYLRQKTYLDFTLQKGDLFYIANLYCCYFLLFAVFYLKD